MGDGVPTFTRSLRPEAKKLSIFTLTFSVVGVAAFASGAGDIGMKDHGRSDGERRRGCGALRISVVSLSPAAVTDDRKRLIALLEVDAGDAEHGAEFGVLDLHRPGEGRNPAPVAGRRSSGAVWKVTRSTFASPGDMAVQYSHRTEALHIVQRAGAASCPSPIADRDRPQRGYGRTARSADRFPLRSSSVFELARAEITETAGLEVDDVDEANEVDAVGVEGIPAGALVLLAVPLLVEFDFFIGMKSCSPGT